MNRIATITISTIATININRIATITINIIATSRGVKRETGCCGGHK